MGTLGERVGDDGGLGASDGQISVDFFVAKLSSSMTNEVPFAPVSADLFAANAKRIRAQIAAIGFRQLLNAELDELGPAVARSQSFAVPNCCSISGCFTAASAHS